MQVLEGEKVDVEGQLDTVKVLVPLHHAPGTISPVHHAPLHFSTPPSTATAGSLEQIMNPTGKLTYFWSYKSLIV